MEKNLYRPEIDGLRALAVAAVVLFHLGLGFPGGYVGVDVFFVISGFLITGIIFRGLERDSFSIAEFWERRIRRIFPALFVMILVTLGTGYALLLPQELSELGRSSAAQTMLVANVYFWRDTGYFAAPAESKPLLHTWSLAVEEQFYLVFPLLLVFFKSQSRQRLFWAMACVALISFGGSVYGSVFHASATFFLMPTRVWELLVGCMIAVAPWKIDSKHRRDEAIAFAGLSAVLLSIFCYDSGTRFPGLAAMLPVMGTAAVIFATGSSCGTLVGRMLSWRPAVFVGLISYSLYLWHWPVVVYLRLYNGELSPHHVALAMACAFVLAVVSWRYIETPCRRPTFLRQRRRLFGTTLALNALTLAAGLWFIVTDGLPSRIPNYSPVLMADTQWNGTELQLRSADRLRLAELPTLGIDLMKNESVDFVVWGDSHGMAISDSIDEVAAELGMSGKAILNSGIPPVPNCYRPDLAGQDRVRRVQDRIMELLDVSRPRHLVLIARWSLFTDGYTELDGSDQGRVVLADNPSSFSETEAPATVLERNLKRLAEFCSHRGIILWIIKQVPETGEMQPAKEYFWYSIGRTRQLSDKRCTLAEHLRRQSKAEAIFGSLPAETVRLIDPAPFLIDSGQSTINYSGGRAIYRDNDHLTRWGGQLLKQPLLEMFRAMQADSTDSTIPAAMQLPNL